MIQQLQPASNPTPPGPGAEAQFLGILESGEGTEDQEEEVEVEGREGD